MVSDTRAPQGTRLNPRFTLEVTQGMSLANAIANADAIGGDWTILLYTGVYAEGDITPNGGANITIMGMGEGRVEIAPGALPVTATIVSGFSLALEDVIVTAFNNTVPALAVVGSTCSARHCTFNGAAGGDSIDVAAGTININHCSVDQDIELHTNPCTLLAWDCDLDAINTAAELVAHVIRLHTCDLGGAAMALAATGACTYSFHNCMNMSTITDASLAGAGHLCQCDVVGAGLVVNGTSNWIVDNSGLVAVSNTDATLTATIAIYAGVILTITRAVGSVVWWQDSNTLKVIPSGTTTDTMIAWAIAAAAAGDVILLHPGLYDETVACKAGVDLKGVGPKGSVVIVRTDDEIIALADNVELQNFTIRLIAPTTMLELIYDNGVVCTARMSDLVFEVITPDWLVYRCFWFTAAGNFIIERCSCNIGGTGVSHVVSNVTSGATIHLVDNDFTLNNPNAFHIQSITAGTWTGGGNRWAGTCHMFTVTNGTITLDKDAIVCSADSTVTGGTVTLRTGENSFEVFPGMQIQHAVAAGRYIFVHPGTYTLTSALDITVSNITIQGAGRQTIITTATDNIDIIHAHGGAGTELTNIIIRDLLVRGFVTGNANDVGVLFDYVDYSKIINVWSELNGEHGIRLASSDHNEIEGCECDENLQYGINLQASVWTRIINTNCMSNTRSGIFGNESHDTTLIGCTCNGNDFEGATYAGISMAASDRCSFTGCHCDGNGNFGLRLERCDRCTVTGGQYNNSYTGDGIQIYATAAGNADYNTIVGVSCTGNAGDGIEIEGDKGGGNDYANKNVVIGCQLLGNGTALEDDGTNTEVGHNITV